MSTIHIKFISYLFLLFLIFTCSESPDMEMESSPYTECTSLLFDCDGRGDYCLFGFKWGAKNNFDNTGVEVDGPRVAGGIVSYSFHELQDTITSISERDLPTLSFDVLPSCAKNEIRASFMDYSSIANIEFVEESKDSASDIKIFVAESNLVCGNGTPNFNTLPCHELSGQIILNPNFTDNCESFRILFLHELGHTLGLGHSSFGNIMSFIIPINQTGLQEGDIKGIQEIYGE